MKTDLQNLLFGVLRCVFAQRKGAAHSRQRSVSLTFLSSSVVFWVRLWIVVNFGSFRAGRGAWGGCEWVVQGRSMRGSCVPTSRRRTERVPRYSWRHLSLYAVLPTPKTSPDSASCLHSGWTRLLFLFLFSFVNFFLYVCFGGDGFAVLWRSLTPRLDPQISTLFHLHPSLFLLLGIGGSPD
jgi:hypothetical protein